MEKDRAICSDAEASLQEMSDVDMHNIEKREKGDKWRKKTKKERAVLSKVFYDDNRKLRIDKNRFDVIGGLINQAAFMGATLDNLIEQMYENGDVTEIYKNGPNQYCTKELPQCKTYLSMIKNYAVVINTLSNIIPEQEIKDELMEFLTRRKGDGK